MSPHSPKALIIGISVCPNSVKLYSTFGGTEQERKSKEKGDGYLLRDKGAVSLWCQSFGRRFTSIIIAGSNIDEATNYSFCKECYVDREIMKDDDTAHKEAIEAVNNAEKENPYFNRKIVLKRVKNLDRWNKDNY